MSLTSFHGSCNRPVGAPKAQAKVVSRSRKMRPRMNTAIRCEAMNTRYRLRSEWIRAIAADGIIPLPVKASAAPYYDWTGFYVGGHVGYSRGNARVTPGDDDSANFRSSFGSLTGGVQGGYNYVLPSRFLLGVEADMSFLNWLAADDVAWTRTTPDTDMAEKIDYMATLRGRLGYAFDHWMVYATGGFAWSLGRFLQTPGAVDDVDKALHLHRGWVAGAGAEVAIAANWIARLEYLFRNFGH